MSKLNEGLVLEVHIDIEYDPPDRGELNPGQCLACGQNEDEIDTHGKCNDCAPPGCWTANYRLGAASYQYTSPSFEECARFVRRRLADLAGL